jgi:hypothetical protein
VQVASAAPSSGGIGGFFSNLFGAKPENQSGDARGTAATASPQGKPQAASAPAKAAQTAAAGRSKPETRPADGKAAKVALAKPQPSPPRQETSEEPAAKPASTTNLLSGAAPTVPTGEFENRFGAWH